jgi:methyl-accepting chemotaxis protein
MSLQSRLLWGLLPFLALAVLGLAAGMSLFARQALLAQARLDGQVMANVLARSIEVNETVADGLEHIISRDLISSARILAQLVAVAESSGLSPSEITQRLNTLVSPDHLSEIWITDPAGHAYLHTVPNIDFQFSSDRAAQPQAAEFWPLLQAREPASVVQALTPREVDGKPFKYVGVSGVDKPRIVQVGLDGQLLSRLRKSLGMQNLLEHVVEEGDIELIQVVDTQGQVRHQASRHGGQTVGELSADDRSLLQELARTGTVQSRIAGDHILIAAPLQDQSLTVSGDAKGTGTATNPGIDWDIEGTVLMRVSMGLLGQLMRREWMVAGLAAAVSLALGTWLVLFATRRGLRPIQTAVAAAERVASGDLSVSLASSGKDETGKLINALGQMVAYLNSLIGQVQRSTIDLVSTANSLSAMSKTQSEEVNNLGSTTTEIAAATKEISATSEELLNTMTGITRVADQTTELANSGQSSLGDMEGAMRSLAEATQSISGRLGLINEKANTIGSVTTTITKIADQTNLLSLNASIEAEKAGEYGLGFAVLAREIRRLADQTAVATLDIEQMVKEMQDSVTGGVMEMDKFAEQVNRSVSDTRDVSQRFGEIILQIQALLPQFDAVHEGMRSQSAGAKQIRDSMVSLTESVRVSAQALEETTAATGRLEGAIAMLRNEISVFRLG